MLPTGEMISCAENDSVRIWDKNKGLRLIETT